MKQIMPNITRLNFLIPLFFALLIQAFPSRAQSDSIRVDELLVMDTVALKIQGPSIDVTFYLNGIVFLSNTKYHQKMLPDHINFGELASYFVPLEYIALESSKPLFNNDPFPYSPAGTSYTRDFQTVYFTKKVEVPGNRMPEKIFEANIINGEVSTFNQLPFTAGPTRFMHPAISTGGDIMIMASDQSPTSGGLDLFISKKSATGWMTPVSLGSEINTSGHEWYPFLDQHNNLFFSSSGHMGYGGFDIYVCLFNGEGWENPQNLSELVNSEKNEIGFTIHSGRKMALYTSEGEESELSDEILKMGLNNSAFISAGIDTKNQDISLLLEDMISSGFTSATYGAASELEIEAGFSLTALPLLGVEETEEEQEPEPEPQQEVAPVLETEPEIIVPVLVVPPPEPDPEQVPVQATDPNQVVFKVQILSSSKAKSQPTVTISGSAYSTWEYNYKGAYRITVGEFASLSDALSFRTKCKSSGYNQAFVAAFRGNERETDPSVFK
jgi:hypothetical protein